MIDMDPEPAIELPRRSGALPVQQHLQPPKRKDLHEGFVLVFTRKSEGRLAFDTWELAQADEFEIEGEA